VKVFRTDDFSPVATIAVGKLPHGIWPSGDGTRVYVGLENDDQMIAIDTLTNKVVASMPLGQAPQAVVYVPNAVPDGAGTAGLQPLGLAGAVAQLTLVRAGRPPAPGARAPTSVSLFDQGLTQVLEAAVTGLAPKQAYTLALTNRADGSGAREPLANFMSNPAGSAIVNAVGPIRQLVRGEAAAPRRYLVIVEGMSVERGKVVQLQAE